MRLPDPFTPNLKVDLLPESSQHPRILSNIVAGLTHNGLRGDLDAFLKNPQKSFLEWLPDRLRASPADSAATGQAYNAPAINSLVVYVGAQGITHLANKSITHSPVMELFQSLVVKFDAEGRYLFLNAIANQLRYPNNHTYYFSCVLLILFSSETSNEQVKEQVTRVLLERLIVHRPHPWGLLITFIELIKNPRYNFWAHKFTHCAPEIEKIFESVSRSCMGPSHEAEGESPSPGTGQ
jgi:CCR4-NOT transcription complex subunit 1